MRQVRLPLLVLVFLSSTLTAFAQRYVPTRPNGCRTRFAYGIITMPAGDCRAMGGAMNGSPADNQWTGCHLDWCSENDPGTFVPAKPGTCAVKAGYGIITTPGADCRRLGGGMNGNPADNEWTSCHLDWCSAGGAPAYSAARVGSCGTSKVAYGIIKTSGAACRLMGGAMNGTPGDNDWTDCHLDWCTTVFASAVRATPEAIQYNTPYKLVTAHSSVVESNVPPNFTPSSAEWSLAALHRSGSGAVVIEKADPYAAQVINYGADVRIKTASGPGYLEDGTYTTAATPIMSVTEADWVASFDHQGWSDCPPGTVMTGYRRSQNGDPIYHLEYALCATVWGTQTETMLRGDWWQALDSAGGMPECPANSFVSGLYRTEGNEIFNIEEAHCAKLKNVSTYQCQMFDGSDATEYRRCPTGYLLYGLRRTGNLSNTGTGLWLVESLKCCRPGLALPVTFGVRQGRQPSRWTIEHPREGIDGTYRGKPVPLGGAVVIKSLGGKVVGANPGAQELYLHTAVGGWETFKLTR